MARIRTFTLVPVLTLFCYLLNGCDTKTDPNTVEESQDTDSTGEGGATASGGAKAGSKPDMKGNRSSGGHSNEDETAAGGQSTGENDGCPRGTAPTGVTTRGDIICGNCQTGQYCPGGDEAAMPCESGSWDDDADPKTACTEKSVCEDLEYVSDAGDATHDRSCSAVSECPWGVETAATSVGDATCIKPVQVAAGGYHTCALLSDGSVECWGRNSNGQLGVVSVVSSSSPIKVSGLSGAVALSLGQRHSCALLDNGTASCWGRNAKGQLGNGDDVDSLVPVAVTGLSGVVDLAAGDEHSCAVLSSGSVKCWGDNEYNQLGSGVVGGEELSPVAVSGVSAVLEVATGGNFSCVLLLDGTARCWGDTMSDQFGGGKVPAVPGLTAGVDIVAGTAYGCVLRTGGSVTCWGSNNVGQLGVVATDTSGPVSVSGLSGAASDLAAGGSHACVLLSNGTLQCWGRNDTGQLGNGQVTGRSTPVSVSALDDVSAITGGGSHSCALTKSGNIFCWGSNDSGQLGDGTENTSLVPIQVVPRPR